MIPRKPRTPLAAATTAVSLFTFLAVASCADDVAQFDVKYAPTFQKAGMTVSILGVFREGRMSPETWDDIGTKISPVFGKGFCPVGYDSKLVSDKPTLAEAIDDYARANGVTDDLLDQLAPAANGDAVLVITVAGRPITPGKVDAGASGATSAPTAPNRGLAGARGRGGGMGTPAPMRLPAVDKNAFEMSASLFSLRDHKSIALVSMGYSGTSGAEALQKFIDKLKESFTGFPCVGWKMDTPIDEKKIHEITSE